MAQSTMNNEADLTPEEKRRQLYDRQVELLKTFLEHGTISQAQYDKSYDDLTEKMGYVDKGKNDKSDFLP